MGDLQHNKTIVVDGPHGSASCAARPTSAGAGSSCRPTTPSSCAARRRSSRSERAFDDYWEHGDAGAASGPPPRPSWHRLGLAGSTPQVAFSPHTSENALLDDDRRRHRHARPTSSAALLARVPLPDPGRDPATRSRRSPPTRSIFVYGISDQQGRRPRRAEPERQRRTGLPRRSSPRTTAASPSNPSPTGGSGTRMHHKFVVIDFDKPTARVYPGSYNFSAAGRHRKRREPAAHPRPPDRRLLRGRGAAHLRPLHFRVDAEGERREQAAGARQAAARPRRGAVVGEVLHGASQGARPQDVLLVRAHRPRPGGQAEAARGIAKPSATFRAQGRARGVVERDAVGPARPDPGGERLPVVVEALVAPR